jgi:hypothetical protein
MKKIIVFLFVFLYSKPLWIDNIPQSNDGIYFVGSSKLYQNNDTFLEEKAKKDALNDAYTQIANYFGVKIESTLKIDTTATTSQAYKKIESTTITKTNQLIFDLAPTKIYKDIQDEYYRIYVLIKLDKITEQKIKKLLQDDKNRYEKALKEIENLIEEKRFYEAKNKISLAKGFRSSSFDDRLLNLEKRLKNILNNMLKATLVLDKTMFFPDEDINIQVYLNTTGYLYIFNYTGDGYELLFPNKIARNPKLKAKEVVILPNEDISVVAYEDLAGKKGAIIAIASKEFLPITQFAKEEIDNVYIFDDYILDNKLFSVCFRENKCRKTTKEYKVVFATPKKYKLQFFTSSKLQKEIKSFLKENGIRSFNSDKVLQFYIKTKKEYSSLLEEYIVTYIMEVKYFNNNHLQKTKKFVLEWDELLEQIKTIIKRGL